MTSLIRALLILLPIHLCAQENILEKRVEIEKSELTLSALIKAVEEQAGVHFSYNPQVISINTTIQIDCMSCTVHEILIVLEKYSIKSMRREKLIILQRYHSKDETASTISGIVRDAATGEALANANLVLMNTNMGTTSNRYGFYSITRPRQAIMIIQAQHLGYTSVQIPFSFSTDSVADVWLMPLATELMEIEVSGDAAEEDRIAQASGIHHLSMQQVKNIASLAGEPDVLKALQFLPGVQSGNEGTTNFSVRGGSYDQNLFLLDEAPVYNPSHALSFFSIFNTDALQNITFYKSAIPVRYGGRLSSVVDVQMKEGNRKKRTATGSIGTIASRLTAEGPISMKSEKASYMLSGRYGYAGSVLNALSFLAKENLDSKISFYDVNAKVNLKYNTNNHFYWSAYTGYDNFYVNQLTNGYSLSWGNKTTTLRWNHIFTPKLFANTTVLYSNYAYRYSILNDSRLYNWAAKFQEINVKQDYDFFVSERHRLSFGGGLEGRLINPGSISPRADSATVKPFSLREQRSVSSYLYLSDTYSLNEKIHIGYGLRYSNFFPVGPLTYYAFDEGSDIPHDSINFSNGKIAEAFHRFDPRIWLSYAVDLNNTVTISYDRTTQYLHLLSNSSVGLPTDIWMPSGNNIEPQLADIYVLSYQHQRPEEGMDFRLSAYYKLTYNILDFIDNANLFVNPYIQSQLLQGKGKSYGAEFFLQKKIGKVQGSVAYTLSQALNTIQGINQGKPFASRYDKRHNISATTIYHYSKRLEVSMNFIFTTGGAYTAPVGSFSFGDYSAGLTKTTAFSYYTARNAARLPQYHRLDLGIKYYSKKNEIRRWKSWWGLDVYNIYNRKNPFSVFVEQDGNSHNTKASMVYLFGAVPTISYNFTF